jgi:hypothetical protein
VVKLIVGQWISLIVIMGTSTSKLGYAVRGMHEGRDFWLIYEIRPKIDDKRYRKQSVFELARGINDMDVTYVRRTRLTGRSYEKAIHILQLSNKADAERICRHLNNRDLPRKHKYYIHDPISKEDVDVTTVNMTFVVKRRYVKIMPRARGSSISR